MTKELKARYNKATKKKKGIMLDEFFATTEYNKVYVAKILRLSVDMIIGYAKSGGKKI